MEYELDRTQLGGWQTVLDTTVFQEETLEMIVPDANPDILRIVDTDGKVLLRTREALEGKVEMSGAIQATVLYIPDGESGARHLDVSIPFTCQAEGNGVAVGCLVTAQGRLRRAETKLLNPRKVLVRAEAVIVTTVFASQEEELSGQVLTDASETVEQLTETREVYVTTSVREKAFEISDEISLPGSRGPAVELLRNRVELQVGESKLIGNKIIFKGNALVMVLCRGEDDSIFSASGELPFSQIVEVAGAGEGADRDLILTLTGSQCGLVTDGEGRTVAVELDVLAQAVTRESQRIEILTDAYSVRETLEARWESHELPQRLEAGVHSQNVREAWETGTPVRDVLDSALWIGAVTQSREGEKLTLTAQAEVSILCVGEDGELTAARRSFTVPCTLDAPVESRCLCRCERGGEVYAAPAAGGLEVRFSLDFLCCLQVAREVTVLTELTASEEETQEGEEAERRPSLVLKMLERGERLWDVAKAGGTTIAEIMRANELTDEADAMGQVLLIPRKR